MLDHLINSKHESFLIKCYHCNTELESRDSEFIGLHHYKTIKCPHCGKIHRHAVDFFGSGHDSWNDEILEAIRKQLTSKN